MVLIHSSLADIILTAVSETFEGMAFSEVEQSSEKLDLDSDLIWSSLEVNSPYCGFVSIIVPRSLISALAEDMFGVDESEITEEMRFDSLAEILNTLTGRMMSGLVKKNEIFELAIPESGNGVPEIPAGDTYEGDYMVCKTPIKLIVAGNEILKLEVG